MFNDVHDFPPAHPELQPLPVHPADNSTYAGCASQMLQYAHTAASALQGIRHMTTAKQVRQAARTFRFYSVSSTDVGRPH